MKLRAIRRRAGIRVSALGLSGVLSFACAPAAPPAVAAAPLASAAPAAGAILAPAPITGPSSPTLPDYHTIVDAPDRSAEDRALDAGRHPLELLSFLRLGPGMKVGEISAGGGYTSELLARTVAPNGVVYGQNAKFILDRYAEKPWSERLKKPVMKNVVRVDSDFNEPFPANVHDLDAVVNVLFYHDTVWMKTDRERMNRAVFSALRSGGQYVVVDHSARAGSGLNDVETLHRIEESVVKDEIIHAGFQLARTADFLKNPTDTRDWSASPRFAGERRGTSDRFVLGFVKP